MHCSTLFSIAATTLLALSAQAAPFPTATLARRDQLPTASIEPRNAASTGLLERRNAASTGGFEKRYPAPTGVFQRRNPAPTGVFDKRNPAPTAGLQRRDVAPPSQAPFPITDTVDDTDTGASCSFSGGKAPIYTIEVPADIASMHSFGPGCPAQGFIDTMREGGDALFGFGCQSNADGGVVLTFTSSEQIGNSVNAALEAATSGQFSSLARCEEV